MTIAAALYLISIILLGKTGVKSAEASNNTTHGKSSSHVGFHFFKAIGIPSGVLVTLVVLIWVLKALVSYGCYKCCRSKYPRQFAKFEGFLLSKLGYQYTVLDSNAEQVGDQIGAAHAPDRWPVAHPVSFPEVVIEGHRPSMTEPAADVQLTQYPELAER